MIYHLICEGACNPQLPAVDAMARDLFHMAGAPGVAVSVPGTALFEAQRRLKHTPHAVRSDGMARCALCGAPRQYGGHPFRRYDAAGDGLAR